MISVVVPALNEQEAIAETVAQAHDTLTRAGLEPFEIIVVDDGSSDETGARAVAAGARVIRHPHSVGYGRSLKDGIAAASYDVIAISDADGSYPIDAIPALVARLAEGFDMVVAARSGTHLHESALKKPLRWLLKRIVEFTATRQIPDINSGLRVFRRSTALNYFDHLCDTFSFTTSLTLAYLMTSRFVDYVPVAYGRRIGTSKVRLFRDSVKTFQYVLEAAIYYNPLRIFLLVTALIVLGAAALFVAALLTKLAVFFFLGIGSAIVAMLTLSMGLLAVLLRQIMIQSGEGKAQASRPAEGETTSSVSQFLTRKR